MRIISILFISILFFVFSNNAFAGTLGISPLKHEFTINVGESKTSTVKVSNNSDSPLTLYTSKEDFIAGDDTGTPKFIKPEDQVSPELSLSNWVKLEEENITLAPKETREIKFNINVPKNGEPGGHYGAIFFSPGVGANSQLSVVQRLGVLLLINVPGDVKISGFLNKFEIGGKNNEGRFELKDSFDKFPINFNTFFKNDGNVHLKPLGKIEIIGDDGNPLKNIGKEVITSPAGAYIGEKMVDYIPVNDAQGNVLPKSERKFESTWEGFGYTVLNEDGTKSVKFKNLTDYYASVASDKQAYLNFWEQVHTKEVSKDLKVVMTLNYEGKDKEKKSFKEEKIIKVTYDEKYVGLNYYLLFFIILIIGALFYYFKEIAPKKQALKEAELKRKIMEEINNNK